MPAIPDALNLTPVEGAPAPASAPAPTDFGLSQVGAEIGAAAHLATRAGLLSERAQAAANAKVIAPVVLPAQQDIETHYAASVANGEATQPNFVQNQVSYAQSAYAKAISGSNLTTQQVTQATQLADQHANTLAAKGALEVAGALAKPIAENYAARGEAAIADATAVAQQITSPGVLAAKAAAPVGSNDLATAIGDIYDRGTAAGLQHLTAAMPDRPDLVAAFNVRQQTARTMAMSEASASQAQTNQQQTVIALNKQLQGGMATLREAPSVDAYNTAWASAQRVIALQPPGWQPDLTRETQAGYASALLSGMAEHGQAVEAQKLLDSGQYNDALGDKGVEALSASLAAAARTGEASTADQAVARAKALQTAQADIALRATTGLGLGDQSDALLKAGVGKDKVNEYAVQGLAADQALAASGPVRQMTVSQLRALATSPAPSPTLADGTTDPDYGAKFAIWQAQKAASGTRLSALISDPAGAVTTAIKPGDQASILQGDYQTLSQGGSGAKQAGHDYATGVLYAQHMAGVPHAGLSIVSDATAQSLVANVNATPPEQRAGAVAGLARLIQNMPTAVRMPDGSTVSPGQLLSQSLEHAGLSPTYAAVLNDFGDRPAVLSLAVRALTDPTLAKPDATLTPANQKRLTAAVQTGMAPWLAQQAHFTGAAGLKQGEVDLATTMTRYFMTVEHQDQATAITSTVNQFQGSARNMGTWSIPTPAANAPGGGWAGFWADGAATARAGAGLLLQAAIANGGANLAGGAAQSAAVAHTGQWRNLPDNSGLQLYTPRTDGSYAPIADKFGRPITASWSELQAIGSNGAVPPAKFAAPPNTPTGAAGTPVPAFNRQAGFNALMKAMATAESSGIGGQLARNYDGSPMTGDDAPRGLMMIRPSAAAPYAQSLYGAPVDAERLKSDNAYNTRIGGAMLAHDVNYFGPTPGGLALAVANHIAGPGNVARMIAAYGDPREPGASVDQWVARISARNPQTGAFVGKVIHQAYQELIAARAAAGG
jgi:hypothetical protein